MADAEDLDYFSHVRRDIEWILPQRATRILEIGCGAGSTLAWLKQRWPGAETVGVDGYAPAEAVLATRVDKALIHDLEQPLPKLGEFDLILALDVLEHLRKPEIILAQLSGMLAEGGSVIVSVPNLAHHSVLRPLLFKRRFDYTDAGMLDRTHLRWFTESSALELMREAGLTVVDGVTTGTGGAKSRVLDRLSFGRLKHYLTMQYVMRGTKGGNGKFAWRSW